MKNTLYLILTVILISCNKSDSYEIIGDVENVPDGTIIKLFKFDGYMGVSFKADTISEGKFRFEGAIEDSLADYYLRIPQNPDFFGRCQIWTENRKIHVTGNSRYLNNWEVKSKVKEQRNHNVFLSQTRELLNIRDSISAQRVIQLGNEEVVGKLDHIMDSLWNLLSETEFDIISNNPNSISAIKRLQPIVMFNKTIPDSILRITYESFKPELKDTYYGKEISLMLTKVESYKIGDTIADFNIYDLEDRKYKFSEFIGGYDYILLEFWSVGCLACRQSFPEMKQFYAEHSDKLSILSLNIDLGKEHWANVSEKENFTWGNFSDKKYNHASAYNLFGVDALPTFILIDKDGKIIHKWKGYQKGIFKDELSQFIVGIN